MCYTLYGGKPRTSADGSRFATLTPLRRSFCESLRVILTYNNHQISVVHKVNALAMLLAEVLPCRHLVHAQHYMPVPHVHPNISLSQHWSVHVFSFGREMPSFLFRRLESLTKCVSTMHTRGGAGAHFFPAGYVNPHSSLSGGRYPCSFECKRQGSVPCEAPAHVLQTRPTC